MDIYYWFGFGVVLAAALLIDIRIGAIKKEACKLDLEWREEVRLADSLRKAHVAVWWLLPAAALAPFLGSLGPILK